MDEDTPSATLGPCRMLLPTISRSLEGNFDGRMGLANENYTRDENSFSFEISRPNNTSPNKNTTTDPVDPPLRGSRQKVAHLRPVHKHCGLKCIGMSIVVFLLESILNAALAVFGIGVGVGLILGDTLREGIPLALLETNNGSASLDYSGPLGLRRSPLCRGPRSGNFAPDLPAQ
jgi:hypothetical protein